MAIVDWTSEGMNWTSLSGKNFYPYLEALRLALLERADGAGLTIPTILNSPVLIGGETTYAWGDAYNDLMSDTITKYVDKDDNSGNWHETVNGPPSWSEATLLTAIGDTVRYPIYFFGSELTSKWALQQYNFLNKLLWHEIDFIPNINTVTRLIISSIGQHASNWTTAYNNAVTDWNNQTAGSSSPSFDCYSETRKTLETSGTRTVELQMQQCEGTFPASSTTFQSTVDFYATLTHHDTLGTATFDDHGHLAENLPINDITVGSGPVWILFDRISTESAAATRAFNGIFTNAEMNAIPTAPPNCGPNPTVSGALNANKCGYKESGSGSVVFKYDGTNGFKFKL